MSELGSRRFFRKDAEAVETFTSGCTKDPVKTMGGINVVPDCIVDEIPVDPDTVLILPGSDRWAEPENHPVLEKAKALLSCGGTVCAICGATVALANLGILDDRRHTSNGPGFLEMFCPTYKGKDDYVDEPAVADNNLITASATGSLLWAKLILGSLDVMKPDTLEAWYAYFDTGKAESFYALMASLQD